MDLHIEGRTAVLSGAAGDMALETAKIFQGEGCNLVLTDIDEDELRAAAGKLSGDVVTVVADLSS
ncbi:MAG: ketoacyl reductase, partial [Pseudomonadota bacterium]